MLRKVAVLGGGSGAHAMAADLTLKGLEVNMCEAPEFKGSFSATLERQEICLIDTWGEERVVKPGMVTTDFEQAIKGVDYIMIVIPAMGHKHFFTSIVPYLKDGQTIVMWPGNYSALLLANITEPSSMKSRFITEDVPYGLVPAAQLAHKFNIDIPIIDATIKLASVINQTDYYNDGRSLEELGIANLSKEELAEVL